MAFPTISVVIPLYNHEPYIESTLASVLSQTSAATEIILIDDGSTDDGCLIAERVLETMSAVRVIRQPNAGAHQALNRAIGISSGEFIAVLNSDDVFLPDKLQLCRTALQEDRSAELIFGTVGIINGEGIRQDTGIAVNWLERAAGYLKKTALPQLSVLNENFVATTSNMVFARSLWVRAGGFQPLRYCHDLDFLMFAYGESSVLHDADHDHILYRVHERNTIAEDLGKVRVEIAAVIAQALTASGTRLLSPRQDRADFMAFTEFLRNKQMNELVCFLMTLRSSFPTRADFYRYAIASGEARTFGDLAAK